MSILPSAAQRVYKFYDEEGNQTCRHNILIDAIILTMRIEANYRSHCGLRKEGAGYVGVGEPKINLSVTR